MAARRGWTAVAAWWVGGQWQPAPPLLSERWAVKPEPAILALFSEMWAVKPAPAIMSYSTHCGVNETSEQRQTAPSLLREMRVVKMEPAGDCHVSPRGPRSNGDLRLMFTSDCETSQPRRPTLSLPSAQLKRGGGGHSFRALGGRR